MSTQTATFTIPAVSELSKDISAVVFKYDKAFHEAEQKNAQSSDFDDLIPVNETHFTTRGKTMSTQTATFTIPAVSELSKDISVVSVVTCEPHAEMVNYIESTEFNAFFGEIEAGQTFFYSGKKKDGIFMKITERTAILVMPNIADGNTELYAALYGQVSKFKSESPITLVSTHMVFSRPHIESPLSVAITPQTATSSLTEHRG